MKKLLVVLGLAMAAFSFQASAATITLVNGSGHFSNNVVGEFTDTWTFTAPANNGIGATATNIGVFDFSNFTISGVISSFVGTLDGHLLTTLATPTLNVLVGNFLGSIAGQHTLVFSGNAGAGAAYGGNVAIAVAQTPIPAAVWLFGSALMGLTGISRRISAKA